MANLTRRQTLGSAAVFAVSAPAIARADEAGDGVGARLAPWRRGRLDIHHLSTGRGDATLIVGPDGTTILIDAGAASRIDEAALPARPDGSRRPGEWIARYVSRRLAETGGEGLDALMVTHIHPDHIGGVGPDSPLDHSGRYRLTGVSDVAGLLPVGRIIDPDFPDYGYPPFEDAVSAENYVAFIRARVDSGRPVERFVAGRADQVGLEHGGSAVRFEVRNLASRGRVWTGQGDEVATLFPPRDGLADADHPDENASSAGVRLSFGAFRYFAAGDLTGWARAGARPWMDALTAAAQAAGAVDVAMVPHHGLFDGFGAEAVRALSAQAWIISAWHASHPSPSTLERLFEPRLYPGPRAIYATDLSPAMDQVAGRLTRRLASRRGHVIVRVGADGNDFRVVTTSAADEGDTVMSDSGRIRCRAAIGPG